MAKRKVELSVSDKESKFDDSVFDSFVSEPLPKYFFTGLINFDLALSGGLGIPLGRMIRIYSESQVGKTTALFTLIHYLISKGKKCIFIAIEPADKLLTDMGLKEFTETGQLKYLGNVGFWGEVENIAWHFMESDYDFLFIDSITAVAPDDEDIIDDKTKRLANLPGKESRKQTVFLKQYFNKIKRTDKSMFYVCQTRCDLKTSGGGGGFWGGESAIPAGGKAAKFFADVQLAFKGQTKLESKDINGDGGSYIVGSSGNILVEKNKNDFPYVNIPFTIMFGIGMSNSLALKRFCEWAGIISGGGGGHFIINLDVLKGKQERKESNDSETESNKITEEDSRPKIHGKKELINWIRENQENLIENYFKPLATEYYTFLKESKQSYRD